MILLNEIQFNVLLGCICNLDNNNTYYKYHMQGTALLEFKQENFCRAVLAYSSRSSKKYKEVAMVFLTPTGTVIGLVENRYPKS